MSSAAPVLGRLFDDGGNITQLKAIAARSPRNVELSLGFGIGRLSAGYAILLLIGTLGPEDFQLDGITLRSGGREGLPADTQAADSARTRVHDAVLRERGADGYLALQRTALATIPQTGRDRLARVRATTPHDPHMAPSLQYPMGGGALQWTLIGKKPFLVAAIVDAAAIAHTADFAVPIGPHAKDSDRARLNRYLEQVVAG